MANEELNEAYIHMMIVQMQQKLLEEHSSTYYQWIKNLITLASSVLVVLISFRNTYIPLNPTAFWLLQCCWSFLFGTIVLGQLALYGQIQAPFEVALRLEDVLKKSKKEKENTWAVAAVQGVTATPNRLFHLASQISAVLFVLALFLLVLFAAINMTIPNPAK